MMPVTFTPEAQLQALEMQKKHPEYSAKPLRVYIEGKGCDGFYYGVAFDEVCDGDIIFKQSSGFDVLVDRESLVFLAGSRVEWVDDERGRGFLVENPQQKKFRGKFFKKQAWQEKLAPRQKARQ